MDQKTLIIVGAGVVGVSTALEAITKYDRVFLIDDPQPFIKPASKGLGRIVRAEYGDNKEYSDLASSSLDRIKKGDCSRFFHQSGRVVFEPDGKSFREVNFEDLQGVPDKQSAGWIEAAHSLQHILGTAQGKGVELLLRRVVGLLWEDTACVGVEMDDGTTLAGTAVLLAMGYKVPEFLRRQDRPMEEGLCKIVLVPWGQVELSPEQYEELKGKPIHVVPGIGEWLVNEEKILWVNNARTAEVRELDMIEKAYPLTENSPYFKETHNLLCWLLPQLKDAPFTLHYCLDLITTKQQFLIRPEKCGENLYVACGLSLHGFKFGESIGKCVVQMMEGNLAIELERLWSGNLDGVKEVHGEVAPNRLFPEGEL